MNVFLYATQQRDIVHSDNNTHTTQRCACIAILVTPPRHNVTLYGHCTSYCTKRNKTYATKYRQECELCHLWANWKRAQRFQTSRPSPLPSFDTPSNYFSRGRDPTFINLWAVGSVVPCADELCPCDCIRDERKGGEDGSGRYVIVTDP